MYSRFYLKRYPFNFRILICVLTLSLLSSGFFYSKATAAVTTEATSVRVAPGSATLGGVPEINVTVFYSDDDDTDNRIDIEWGLDGKDFTLGSHSSSPHPLSPYSYTITPLDNNEIYQIRVTLTDPDNNPVSIVKTFTGKRPYNPLIHNAVSTGSGVSKWPSGWGTTEGQYGEFTCKTCHDRGSGNIKRIRKDWSDPALPEVPVKSHADTIDFQTTIDGSAQYALDDSTNHTTSNRICEACHTSTAHHRHDELTTPDTADHQSTKDCTTCHKHQNAFAPSGGCSSCHGGSTSGLTENNFWPDSSIETTDNSGSANDSGEHLVHMTRLSDKVLNLSLAQLLDDTDSANKQLQLCNYCHENPGSDGDHMSGDDAEVTRFLAMDGTADTGIAGAYSGSCSSLDCHNGVAVASPDWYAGSASNCLMCHTQDSSNSAALIDPTSGLHYNASPNGAILHNGNFGGSGDCQSCHQTTPSDKHFNNIADTPDTATYNFQATASIDIKLNNLADATDDTCAASCHSDNKNWYRFWTADAFDGTAFDTSTAAAITTTIQNTLPVRCRVCHGEFATAWAEGTAHFNMDADNTSSGASHNSQNPNINPGAACVDCHLYPDHMTPGAGAIRHKNGLITLTDDQTAPDEYTPYDDDETGESRLGVYCADCHEANAVTRDGFNANTFEYSAAFPAWAKVEIIPTDRNPEYTCFSGANGCHGDTTNNWWPNLDSTDPIFYPNREGAHFEHGTTIGELLAAQANLASPGSRIDADGDGRVDATQDDRNMTCNFCHPMAWNVSRSVWESLYHRANTPEAGAIVTDVFGGYTFPGADKKGAYISGDPSFGGDLWFDIDTDVTTGFAYQLEPNPMNPGLDPRYPLDHDGEYWQYLDAYKANSAVRHGVCSNVACHSNAPFTPQWYGDKQPPGQIADLTAYTHNQDAAVHDIYEKDAPGSVQLHWTAPGDNGDFSGTAYEYEVYYSAAGQITDGNLGSATRAGGAATVLRQGEAQIMVVDGLTPGIPYWFAVVTKDQPTYKDDNHDDIYDTFVADGLRSVVGATSVSVAAHTDDVFPVFWGINKSVSHDSGDAVNLFWDAARDHLLPITYLVYWSDYSLKTHLANGGTLPVLTKPGEYNGGVYSFGYTEGSPPTIGGVDYYINVSTTSGMSYQVQGLGSGVLYNFLVRAEDGSIAGNVDDNMVVAMTMANTMPQERDETKMAILSGASSIVMQVDPLNPDWGSVATSSVALSGTDSVTFIATGELDGLTSRETWVQGISVDLQVENSDRKLPQSFSVQFGYQNGAFTPIGSEVNVGLGRRANRVMKIGLSANYGIVPANTPLALRFTRTTSSGSISAINLDWGDATNKGQILLTAQPINHQPSAAVFNALSRAPGGYVDITWSPSNDGVPFDGGQTIHYDIFGSADDGVTWPYVIGTNLTNADAGTGVTWDTVGDGLDLFHAGNYNAKIRIDASDGYLYELTPGSGSWTSHRSTISGTVAINNSQDDEAPAAVTINHVEPRPKQGAAFLHWIAVGNDGYNHGTRAAYYDIRFRKTADGPLAANWDGIRTVRVEGEPVPGFAGTAEDFELLNMTPDTSHEVAIVTCDSGEDAVTNNADDNCSGLSNVYTITSGQYYCGICHSTPPDAPDTSGTHRQHGYTLEDCAKCHGDGTGPDDGVGAPGPNDVTQYDGRHYDGVINIGWAKDTSGNHLMMAKIAPTDTSNVTVNQGSGVIYNDPDGAGGYNSNGAYTATANTDSGSCMNFIGANANGCHGPFEPKWAPDTVVSNPAAPTCSDCHGDKSAARDLDPYGRVWDCNVAGAPSELVKASPPQANHGGTTTDDRYVGAHEVHLNSSFRFAKGDSCRLCHRDTMDLGLHADGNVDVIFDAVADQDEATAATIDQNWPEVDIKGASCSSMNNVYCHDTGANWAEPGAKCNGCHGMSDKTYDVTGNSSTIGHVSSHIGTVVECTYCHVAGHPQSPDGIVGGDPDTLLINNNAAVGINYRSGGIHLRSTYPWGTYTTLAEICWGCHEREGISEWGTNTSAATGASDYNFGSLSQRQWTGAIWSSGYGQAIGDPFYYKRGYIQSTHTTDPSGTSKVIWNSARGRYDETPDSVDKIRCSNCHDVHDSNMAPGDTMSGRPYLRGTWMANPYEEDGAPYNRAYAPATVMGAVPRGGTGYDQLGGFYIDQNNVVPGTGNTTQTEAHYPTSGWTIQSSAGLCVLCHGDNVDAMDQRLPGTDPVEADLWLGSNGHSNSVLGGSFSAGVNIFDYTHGRPAPNSYDWGGGRPKDQNHHSVQVPDMAYLDQGNVGLAGGGYRGQDANSGMYVPQLTAAQPYAFNAYDWGATVDGTTVDQMYHQFSCSKCHNPHASRLPKLMITNCLDIRHNTWDDSNSSLQNTFTSPTLTAVDRGMPAGYYASAQNCHRFDGRRSDTTQRGGWNKVTPWAFDNDETPSEHKGSQDPAYNARAGN